MIATLFHLSLQTRIVCGAIAAILLLVIIEFIRRHRLQERYTVIWFCAALALLLAVAFPRLMEWLALSLGIHDTNAAFFAVLILAILALLLNLTVVVSRLSDQSIRLAQELALEKASRQRGQAVVTSDETPENEGALEEKP